MRVAAAAVSGEDIVRVARAYLNTPFRHAGRNRLGLDCAGLIVVVAQELGLPVEDRKNYTPQEYELHPDRLLQELLSVCEEANPPWRAGDLFLVKVGTPPVAQHLAIWTGEGTVIHANQRQHRGAREGRVSEDPWRGKLWEALAGVYRWRGLG